MTQQKHNKKPYKCLLLSKRQKNVHPKRRFNSSDAAREYSRPVFTQQLGHWDICCNLNSAAGQHFCKEKMFTSNNIHSQLLLQQKHIKTAQKSIHAKNYYWLFSGCKQSCKLSFYLKIFYNRVSYYIFRKQSSKQLLKLQFYYKTTDILVKKKGLKMYVKNVY